MFLVKLFKYFEPAWTGNDGKFSNRSAMAIILCVDFIRNISHVIHEWEPGKSEGAALLLGIEAGLIAGLLALKTYQGSIIGNHFNNIQTNDCPKEDKQNKIEEVVD